VELGLKDKRALVLGASKGLGRAVACELVNERARVAICARNAAVLERTASEIGAAWFVCDLSEPGAATRLVAGARALGAPDIVLVNSGGPPTAPFDQLTADQWRSAFDNLFMSAVEIVNAVLPSMRAKKWGRILFVTSDRRKGANQSVCDIELLARRNSRLSEYIERGGGGQRHYGKCVDAGLHAHRTAGRR
jgi:3-oxoacyl-[acyl-carrier protein] reductase